MGISDLNEQYGSIAKVNKTFNSNVRKIRMGLIYFCLGLVIGIIALQMYMKYEKAKWKARFENEKRIFQLVENSKDIVYYYQVKPELQFKYLSPSIEKFLGQ